MAELRVPIRLIWRLCYPAGHRLNPNPVLTDEQRKNPVDAIVVQARVVPSRNTSFEKGNLPEHDYKYYQGSSMINSQVATCRWCQTVVYGEKARLEHKAGGCLHWIDVLGEWMRTDGSCVVCETKTSFAKWGIPLCSTNCINAFRYFSPTPWRDEQLIVKNFEKGRKVGHVKV